jgi:hypothetical protein
MFVIVELLFKIMGERKGKANDRTSIHNICDDRGIRRHSESH